MAGVTKGVTGIPYEPVGYSHGSESSTKRFGATSPADTITAGDSMSQEKNDKVRIDVTEEQRRQAEQTQQNEQDVEFQAEELEERIAPAKLY
jgi:hypothetical protein